MEPMPFKAEGDLRGADYFKCVGERRFGYWGSLICPSLYRGLAASRSKHSSLRSGRVDAPGSSAD